MKRATLRIAPDVLPVMLTQGNAWRIREGLPLGTRFVDWGVDHSTHDSRTILIDLEGPDLEEGREYTCTVERVA